ITEQGLLPGQVYIRPKHIELGITRRRSERFNGTTRDYRQKLQHPPGCGIKKRHRDLIVRKGRSVKGIYQLLGPSQVRKVARQLGTRGRKSSGRGRLAPVVDDLEGSEYECFVLDDGSAGRSSVLVLDQLRFGGLKKAPRIEIIVAVKFPERAVKLICSLPA